MRQSLNRTTNSQHQKSTTITTNPLQKLPLTSNIHYGSTYKTESDQKSIIVDKLKL